MIEDILFPDVKLENWQMMTWERIALTGVLSRVRPKGAIEVGVFHGGSLSLAGPYCENIIGIDIDPDVLDRVCTPQNVEILIAPSSEAIPRAFAKHDAAGRPVNYVLIDGDHSSEGVRRDLELVLRYIPREPMFVLMHDTGNSAVREGLLTVDWASNAHLHSVDFDFVPGQIIEHSVAEGRIEVWGGLGMAYFDPTPRQGDPVIRKSAETSIGCLHEYCRTAGRPKKIRDLFGRDRGRLR